MSEFMRSIAVFGKDDVRMVDDVIKPEIKPYECLVKTRACGFCNGTDFHIIRGQMAIDVDAFPILLGHEGVGEIVEVGSKVKNYRVGQRFINPPFVRTTEKYGATWGQMSDYVLGDVLGLAGVPAAADQLRSENQTVNFLQGGLSYSDVLTTVSPTYAQEIQNAFYGERLEDLFRRRESVLHGILNGIDTAAYDPAGDPALPAPYSAADKSGKALCKAALQKELGLKADPDVPLVAMIGRLTGQKGLDLVQCVLPDLLREDIQIAVLGTGDWEYEEMLKGYALGSDGKMSAQIRFDEALSHRVYAGADILLMPSLFEPCGLAQMIAMRYGTLPVVRETGGLKDTVLPYNQYTGEGTGFSFANYNAHEMMHILLGAAEPKRTKPAVWDKLMDNAMAQDFSWEKAAEAYIALYYSTHPEITPYKK